MSQPPYYVTPLEVPYGTDPMKEHRLSLKYMNNARANAGYLYHYTTADTAIKHILPKSQLKFSCMKDSKDPLESEDFQFSAIGTVSGNLEAAERTFRDLMEFGRQQNSIIKSCVKFACFSVDTRTTSTLLHHKGYSRSRMWSQYAEGHAGVCIAFDKAAILRRVRSRLTAADLLIRSRVHYADDLRDLSKSLFLKPRDGVLTQSERLRRYANIYFCNKLNDYRDEAEYRICFYRTEVPCDGRPELCDVSDAFTGIILGNSFPAPFLPSIRQLAKGLSIPVFQIKWYVGTPYVWKVYPKSGRI